MYVLELDTTSYTNDIYWKSCQLDFEEDNNQIVEVIPTRFWKGFYFFNQDLPTPNSPPEESPEPEKAD